MYNKSEIMRDAWYLYREHEGENKVAKFYLKEYGQVWTSYSFSQALKQAWANHKASVKNTSLKELKPNNGYTLSETEIKKVEKLEDLIFVINMGDNLTDSDWNLLAQYRREIWNIKNGYGFTA